MMRVVDVWVESIEDAGCTNGNYPAYEVTFNTGDVCCGTTCRCGNGCSGTDRLPVMGQIFRDWDALTEYLES